jgi:dTDP-4-amino-4,6-dideoxygalactose transaminase
MTEPDVPFVDLALAHQRVAVQVRARFDEVLDTTSFVLGPAVTGFESEYAAYSQAKYCVGVGNGTDAIELALRSCGIGQGDEVIIPANTFVATAEAVLRAGADIVFADMTTDHLVDPVSVADRVTDRTRAVIGVHLYGQMAPMELLAEAAGPGVILIEDAAQSQGARRNGRRAGSIGLAAATSFYPGKNLGAYGDAGAVTTSSGEVADRLRALRNHGGVRRYEHGEFGVNSRLDSLQAAVLSTKLAVLDDWNDERRYAANFYRELLADEPRLTLPASAHGNEHVWHLFVVQCDQRDTVLADLSSAGIGAGIHYPTPVHLLRPFAHLGYDRGDFPVSEAAAARILSLPIYPGITPDQQVRVAETLQKSLSSMSVDR